MSEMSATSDQTGDPMSDATSGQTSAPEATAPVEVPEVSIAIPTCEGRHLLVECLRSLDELDYPAARLEILVYDNGSRDGTREWLAAEHPAVRVVAAERNDGF